MSDSIEIEAKALISKEDYEKLASLFKEKKSYVQINYYIDTKNSDLRKKGLALRVRFKDTKFEMTVKVPRVEGHIEKNVYISEDEFEGINGGTSFPNNEIKKYLEDEGIDTSTLYIKTVLSTRRIDAEYEGGELAIDMNHYSGVTDYEVELEHKDMATAERYLKKLFDENGIPFKINKKSKVRRALEAIGE